MDELPIAGVNPHVGDSTVGRVKENQVALLHMGRIDVFAFVELLGGRTRELYALLAVNGARKSGAVETSLARSTIHIGNAAGCVRGPDQLRRCSWRGCLRPR